MNIPRVNSVTKRFFMFFLFCIMCNLSNNLTLSNVEPVSTHCMSHGLYHGLQYQPVPPGTGSTYRSDRLSVHGPSVTGPSAL